MWNHDSGIGRQNLEMSKNFSTLLESIYASVCDLLSLPIRIIEEQGFCRGKGESTEGS